MVDDSFEIYISALSVANILYVVRKKTKENRKEILKIIKSIFIITTLDENILETAMETEFKDYEDGLQFISAKQSDCEAIVTRNKKDFSESTINVFTPEEFLEFYEL